VQCTGCGRHDRHDRRIKQIWHLTMASNMPVLQYCIRQHPCTCQQPQPRRCCLSNCAAIEYAQSPLPAAILHAQAIS
jgi:hypothetical protein